MGGRLTAKGRATRSRIVAGAAEVLREKGYAKATLDDVARRTRTSKSQLFHYFPDGKDELLAAVARFEADQVMEDQEPHLSRLDSWEAWQEWKDSIIEHYETQGERCALGSLVLRMGRTTPGSRALVTELMGRWQGRLAEGMRTLQAGGLLPADVDVDTRAAALLAAIQGGVSILMSTGRSAHLRAALDQGIEDLRRTGTS